MSERHVIVVGAGVGGLSAALDLAASGVRVTVLERHARPGGKMRELRIGDHRVDSGPTVFTMRWVFEELFADAGLRLDERLGLTAADRLARHSWADGSRLDLYADMERSVEAIGDFAGATEARAYREFARASQRIFETLDEPFMRSPKPSPTGLSLSLGVRGLPRLYATKPFSTLWRELGNHFRDPRLRQLFGRYATYCGSSPFAAPATLMLIAHAERAGVWLVDGGMQRLAEALESAARDHDARFRYDSHVAALTRRGRRVTGVELADGERLDADAVVFNGDVKALSDGLLGAGARRAAAIPRNERSLSAVTWSLLARPRGFDLAFHSVLFGRDYPAEFRALFDEHRVPDDPTVYVCAQDRGAGAAAGDRQRLFFLMNAPARSLSAREIDDCHRRLRDCLHTHGLQIDTRPEDASLTTPDDFAALFPATDGALYGRPTHGWTGSFDRPGSRSRLDGLFFAGGTVHPGPGVPMTAISGRLAADAVRSHLASR